jgi:hypothetical protein
MTPHFGRAVATAGGIAAVDAVVKDRSPADRFIHDCGGTWSRLSRTCDGEGRMRSAGGHGRVA